MLTVMHPDATFFELPYDSLIVAAGAGQSYFGRDEFSRWAPGMKTINDALELRGRILGAFEMAEARAGPGKTEGLAHLRRRRRRSDRSGDRGTDRRAVEAGAHG